MGTPLEPLGEPMGAHGEPMGAHGGPIGAQGEPMGAPATDGFKNCLENPTKNQKSEKTSVILDKTEVVELIELIIFRPVAPRDHFLNDVS